MRKHLDLVHPGEVLEEEFMRPQGLSANALAKAIDVPVTRVSEIVRGRRGVTADTALRLGRYFGTTPELWLGLQSEYDLRVARLNLGESLQARVEPLKTATPSAALEVREARAPYRARTPRRDHDRRRRRSGKRVILEPKARRPWPAGYWKSWGAVPADFRAPDPLPGGVGAIDLDS